MISSLILANRQTKHRATAVFTSCGKLKCLMPSVFVIFAFEFKFMSEFRCQFFCPCFSITGVLVEEMLEELLSPLVDGRTKGGCIPLL